MKIVRKDTMIKMDSVPELPVDITQKTENANYARREQVILSGVQHLASHALWDTLKPGKMNVSLVR